MLRFQNWIPKFPPSKFFFRSNIQVFVIFEFPLKRWILLCGSLFPALMLALNSTHTWRCIAPLFSTSCLMLNCSDEFDGVGHTTHPPQRVRRTPHPSSLSGHTMAQDQAKMAKIQKSYFERLHLPKNAHYEHKLGLHVFMLSYARQAKLASY